MKCRGLAISAAVLLALCAPAGAAPFTPELDRAYKVAVGFWHAEPTNCTTLDRQIVADAAMPLGAEGWATIPEQPGACGLYLQRTLASPQWFGRACAVLIHEVGHLLGYRHSEDRANVMYPEVIAIPGTCWRAELRELNRRERLRRR